MPKTSKGDNESQKSSKLYGNKMAETDEANSEGKKNFFSLFPRFEFRIPFLNQNSKPEAKPESVDEVGAGESKRRSVGTVSFPTFANKVAEPLEIEAEVGVGRTSNPIVLWQVYALGGFLVLQWAWARWKERKERGAKKDSSEDDEEQVSVPDNEDYQEFS